MIDRKLLDASMPNDDAWSLGRLAACAGHPGRTGVGDSIDRGLILASLLREHGYGIVKLPDGAKKSTLHLETPLVDTWHGLCALVALDSERGREMLRLRGWTPPGEPG